MFLIYRNKKITLIYEMCDENLDYLKELNKIPNLYYHQMIYPFGNGNHNRLVTNAFYVFKLYQKNVYILQFQ